jgi:hypothetical protein
MLQMSTVAERPLTGNTHYFFGLATPRQRAFRLFPSSPARPLSVAGFKRRTSGQLGLISRLEGTETIQLNRLSMDDWFICEIYSKCIVLYLAVRRTASRCCKPWNYCSLNSYGI